MIPPRAVVSTVLRYDGSVQVVSPPYVQRRPLVENQGDAAAELEIAAELDGAPKLPGCVPVYGRGSEPGSWPASFTCRCEPSSAVAVTLTVTVGPWSAEPPLYCVVPVELPSSVVYTRLVDVFQNAFGAVPGIASRCAAGRVIGSKPSVGWSPTPEITECGTLAGST